MPLRIFLRQRIDCIQPKKVYRTEMKPAKPRGIGLAIRRHTEKSVSV